MFERNRSDLQEKMSVAVRLLLDDGSTVAGKLHVPASRSVFEVLNGPALFVEFEPYEDERKFVAKAAIKAVTLLAGSRPIELTQKARDMDGFDPHVVLGVTVGAAWDDVRAAYLSRAKTYHPDRIQMADLPQEVTAYMTAMSRRVNAAYGALEVAHQARRAVPKRQPEAVFVSNGRH